MAGKGSGTFAVLGLMTNLCKNLGKIKITKPTPIQQAAIPSLLSLEKHHLIVAEAGRGKTLAYLLPILHRLKENAIKTNGVRVGVNSPSAIVVVSTEAQARNMDFLLRAVTQDMGLKSAALRKDESLKAVSQKVADGVDLLITTPDMSAMPELPLTLTRDFVIDDAEASLDSIASIAKAALSTSRVILSTANPLKIGKFLREHFPAESNDPLRELVKIEAGNQYEDIASIKHSFIPTSEDTRTSDFLTAMISRRKLITNGKSLIFCASLQRVQEIELLLRKNYFTAVALHSDLSAKTKERNVWKVSRGLCKVLVVNDVSAREFDIPEVKLVASVDFPKSSSDYAFRAGFALRSSGAFLCMTSVSDQPLLSDYTRFFNLSIKKPTSPVPAISHATN